jgi:hypothetical protein
MDKFSINFMTDSKQTLEEVMDVFKEKDNKFFDYNIFKEIYNK